MGLLYLGTPLTWDEAKQHAEHVRYHGVTQFLHIWDRLKDRKDDELLWGDEVRRHHHCFFSSYFYDIYFLLDRIHGHLF